MQINWFKLNYSAKLPTKREEDAGFDIYTTENNVLLMPHQKHQFSTGLAVAPEKGWWMFYLLLLSQTKILRRSTGKSEKIGLRYVFKAINY